jgi:fructuronate reductase
VTPYELMKLRCLNGTHSSLAYLGYLAGFETVAEASADPDFARFLKKLWKTEIIPTLDQDYSAYAEALLERYQNPGIRHRLWQIAMDGSQKLPQRILGTVADNLKVGRACPGLMLAIAAWMKYVSGVDEKYQPIDVKDPLAAELKAAVTSPDPVSAILALRQVFPAILADNATFRAALVEARTLLATGAHAAVKALG